MESLTRLVVVLSAALATLSFSKDVTQPVKRGAVELGSGVGYAQSLGKFDAGGDFHGDTNENASAAYGVPLTVKYGLGGGFDLKATWSAAFTNKQAGDLKGMSQPSLGLKYTQPWGGFLTTFTFPFATGDFDRPNLPTAVELGGLVRKRLPHFRFVGLASYISLDPGSDLLHLQAQPEILWPKKIGTYISLDYVKAFNKNADLLLLSPGVRGDFSAALSWDGGASISAAGHNSPALWALRANLSWTLFR